MGITLYRGNSSLLDYAAPLQDNMLRTLIRLICQGKWVTGP